MVIAVEKDTSRFEKSGTWVGFNLVSKRLTIRKQIKVSTYRHCSIFLKHEDLARVETETSFCVAVIGRADAPHHGGE